jgi:mannose-6-phosphate isomerase
LVKNIYAEIMHSEEARISRCIDIILDRIQRKNNRSLIEERFLIEYNNYGYDVGLLSLLLFNFVNLDPNAAIFTPAGIPHAYLKGNIIECMANSDNVVRAGLTPKFKDICTLVEMLDVDSEKTMVDVKKGKESEIYKTPADEFQIEKITAQEYRVINNEELNIFLVLNGEIRVSIEEESSYNYKTGDVILIPAILSNYIVSIKNNADVYKISVP